MHTFSFKSSLRIKSQFHFRTSCNDDTIKITVCF